MFTGIKWTTKRQVDAFFFAWMTKQYALKYQILALDIIQMQGQTLKLKSKAKLELEKLK